MTIATLDELSSVEAGIHDEVMRAYNTGADIPSEIEARYAQVFESYSELAAESALEQEALKRATFLAWFNISEPTWLTGLGALPPGAHQQIAEALKRRSTDLDDEFRWMLTYYFFVADFALPGVWPALDQQLVPAAGTEALLTEIEPEPMRGRGLLGRYFESIFESLARRQA